MIKKMLTLLAFFLTFALALPLFAIDIVHCECGYTGGGNCIPCDESSPTDKALNSNEGGAIPQKVCPCGTDAGGNCTPCDEPVHENKDSGDE